MEIGITQSWQIRWSLPLLWSELGNMVHTGLCIALDWQETKQMLIRTFTRAWGMTIVQVRVLPTTKRFWVRDFKPTEGPALSHRHGVTSSGARMLEFQVLSFEGLYLASSTSIIPSTATPIRKIDVSLLMHVIFNLDSQSGLDKSIRNTARTKLFSSEVPVTAGSVTVRPWQHLASQYPLHPCSTSQSNCTPTPKYAKA